MRRRRVPMRRRRLRTASLVRVVRAVVHVVADVRLMNAAPVAAQEFESRRAILRRRQRRTYSFVRIVVAVGHPIAHPTCRNAFAVAPALEKSQWATRCLCGSGDVYGSCSSGVYGSDVRRSCRRASSRSHGEDVHGQ